MTIVLIWFSALSFLGYGASCIFAPRMRQEFERYGLARFRVITGILQLLGAAGLIVGLKLPFAGMIASGGLALQMLLGLGVRIKIRDTAPQCLPALAYFLINAWIFLDLLGT